MGYTRGKEGKEVVSLKTKNGHKATIKLMLIWSIDAQLHKELGKET